MTFEESRRNIKQIFTINRGSFLLRGTFLPEDCWMYSKDQVKRIEEKVLAEFDRLEKMLEEKEKKP